MSRLHEMELHEKLHLAGNGYDEIMRVPGGWLYRVYVDKGGPDNYEISQTFVPYSDEFKDVVDE